MDDFCEVAYQVNVLHHSAAERVYQRLLHGVFRLGIFLTVVAVFHEWQQEWTTHEGDDAMHLRQHEPASHIKQ